MDPRPSQQKMSALLDVVETLSEGHPSWWTLAPLGMDLTL